MKRLLFLITLPLMGMQSPKPIKTDLIDRPSRPLPSKRVSFESDMNKWPLPNQIPDTQLRDDVQYLHVGYDQARVTINKQSDLIHELMGSVAYAHKRIDFLQESLENLNNRVNRVPWYKRILCFKRHN